MKKYIKIENTENEFLKIDVYYSLGGMNYWNGKVEPRGYYLSVQRVERKNEGSYTTESFTVGRGGVRSLLLEVKRKSDKAAAQAVELARAKEVELAKAIIEGRY